MKNVLRDGVYIPHYRYLIEQKIGRKLRSDEHVHHINLNHEDDRIENLKLMSKHEHLSLHGKLRHKHENKHVTYTIEEELINEFNKVADELAINKSKWIENKMKELIKSVKNES